jgi:hypothetical protein
MSDPNLRVITGEDLRRFFESRGAAAECPVCAANQWHNTIDPLSGSPYAIKTLREILGYGGMPVVVLYCGNCGFIRHHARNPIVAFLEASGE